MSRTEIGSVGRHRHVVTQADTAIALGSGDVPVLATPRLLAWVEAATVTALAEQLDEDESTVGTLVELDHAAAGGDRHVAQQQRGQPAGRCGRRSR